MLLERNKEFFDNPNKFTQMKPKAQIFFIKYQLNHFKRCLHYAKFILEKCEDKQALLPLYFKIGEIVVNKSKTYLNSQFLDVFIC